MNDGFRSILRRPGASRLFVQSVCLGILLAAPAVSAENVLTFARSPDCYVSTTGRITTTAFTVEMWFRQTGFDSENQLFHQDVPGDTGRLILTTVYGTNRFHIGNNMLYAKTRIASNTWTHVAYVRNASGTGSIYLNGALDNSAAMNTIGIATNTIVIGRLARANAGFRGQISDVRVWNVARAQADIQGAMSNRLAGTESGLIAYWRLDEGFGATAFNRASAAHGAVTGATWSDLPDCPVTPLESRGAWNATGGGNWSDTANWLNLAPANGTNGKASFTNSPPSAIAVTNDLPSLTLGQLTVNGSSPHTFTGNGLTLTNAYWAGRLVSTNGAHTLGLPLALSALGLSAEPQAPASLTLSGVISGPGGVTANAGASGGGTVTLSGANTYTGPTALSCGTLAVSSLADGGAASAIGASSASAANLLLGPGTLRYAGPTAVTDRGYTLQAGGNPIRAAVLDTDSDITFAGPVTAVSGAFIKTGSGTVRYTYPGAQTLAVHESGIDALMNLGANGDSPTTGFSGFTVSNGKVILGVPGQTNTVNCRITIGHYTTTNANAETAGELQIDDGVLNCNTTVSIARGNGSAVTAPAGAASRLTVNGGTFNLNILSMAVRNVSFADFNPRPVFDVNGGLVNVGYACHIAETTGSVCTINVRGGTLRVTGSNGGNGIILGGPSSASAGVGILNLSGTGLVDVAYNVSLANMPDGRGYLNLHGGTLVARTIAKGSGREATVLFNGGVFQPRAEGNSLGGLTAAYVSTNGALFDTSLASYTVAQSLLHDPGLGAADGGLVKLGANNLTLTGYGSTYTGPTVVSNGTLAIAGALPAGNVLAAAAGGEALIGGSATQTVAAASVTLSGSGTLGFAFTADGAANDRLAVASTPSLGSGRIALYLQSTRLPFTRNGTYTILTYAGADPVVAGLTCANAAYGKAYAFAAAGGSVTVTIASDADASVWNVNASGTWATGANWTVVPAKAAGDQVRFDSAITAPATVTTAGETVGEIFFNNPVSYTLGGSGLTLDNDTAPAVINVESGAHAITAPLTLADDTLITLPASTRLTLGAASGASSALTAQGNGTLALTAAPAVKSLTLNLPDLAFSNTLTVTAPLALQRSVTVTPAQSTTVTVSSAVSGSGGLTKAGSNTLALDAANTYAGPTTVNGGTLTASALANGGAASSIGASPAASANLVLGPATFRYTGPAVTVNRGYTLASGSKPAVLRAEGDITFAGQALATSGSILKTGPGTVSYTYPGPQTLAVAEGNVDTLLNIGPNGDAPTAGFSGLTISDGKVILGVPGQTNTINNRITVGHYTTTAAGAETAGELVINGGVLNCNTTVSIARGNGTTTTAGTTGLASRITVNGGIVNFGLLALGFKGGTPSGYNARPACDINGGTVTLSSQVYVGESQGSTATLNVRGGTLRINGQASNSGLHIGGYQNPSGTGILNLSGTGAVDVVYGVTLATFASGAGTLNLDGGTLIASNILKGAGSSATLRFNGGTYQPRTAIATTLSGLTAAYVSTNGAAIDTSLANSYTVAQNLLHDPALGAAPDGGLVKLGTNSLSLTGTGNTFTGPVDVRCGLLRARLGGTNDLAVATNAYFDALSDRATVGDLRGGGTLTNGVIALTGTLDAGTNNAPAGARLTVQNLSLVAGSTFACTWATNALGQVTNDFVAVSGALAPEGAGFVDFGRTEANPIPMPFSATVMSYGTFSGSFAGWKAVNTGLPAAVHPALVITAADGRVTVQVRYSGLLLMVK